MARKRRQLGSSVATHTKEANRATREVENAAALTVNKARNGDCMAATRAYSEMERAIGVYTAHLISGGSGWEPAKAIIAAEDAFTTHCVRGGGGVAGLSKKRRR